ncbi:MAG: TonB-dependent receptor [Wenzhouxiangellaceae bacterium]|nr:TonB-dependent receptor [Wenzhouxiangellaceae bacterium]MBS3746862.1 TonB-dependent receptor [Wenzhouxiangellaceae bacterium]MBS3824142.1 TonB-dependent receptor [Wenzhouxiangellaceae bacterium]
MMKKNRLSQAILWGLAATATTLQAQEDQNDQEEGNTEIERIVVTATKTEEVDLQQAPLTVQALDESSLSEQNIGNFDDLRNNVPGLNAASRGPGQQTIFIRGMAVQPITVLLSGAQGTMPNVALYLDEQPVTAPGRNLDVYATDLRRIEVLPGPQGTLFGASSQAGTIRYITNKPQLFEFNAGFSAEASFTKDGEMNSSGEGFLNIPIGEKTAARLTFYNVNLGGYIDNVRGEFTLDPEINPESAVDLGPDATYETTDNGELVEDNFNDSFYKGVRAGLYHEFNRDWSVLVQNTYQELGADGVFDYDPEIGDLKVSRFFPDELEDKFNQTSWTVEGRAGMLDLVYTGAYLYREVEQSVDYTGYNNAGAFIAYYTCTYDNPSYIVNYDIDPQFITENRQCLDPTKGTKIKQDHTRSTHEFRVSTPAENRWRLIGGVFYDDYELDTQDDFYYLATPDLGFAPNAPISDAFQVNPETRPPGVAFFNDIRRTEEQLAFFGEFGYDVVPNTLRATVGLRYYEIDSGYRGSSNFADGIFQGSVNTDRGRNYDVSGGHRREPLTIDDVITRFNISYTPTDSLMFFFTRSEGFRPGGWNRGGGIPSANPEFPTVSATYDTDDVTNWELGWKTLLFDNSLRLNGSAYFVEWENMQVSRFDPQNVSILTFIENSADSEIFGIEGDFSWRATQNLTLSGSISYNDTELTDVDAQVIELAPVGSSLPLVPELQGFLRARYEKSLNVDWADTGYVQLSGNFVEHSFSSLVAEERRRQAGYGILDARVGISRESWNIEGFVENLTDKRAELFINTQDDIPRITTNRPLTAGVRVSYRFLPN